MKKLMFTQEDLENAYNESSTNAYYDNGIMFNDYFENLENVGQEMFSKEDVLKILINFEKDRDWSAIGESGIENWLDEYILENSPKVEEERIPITYGTIKNTCGWSKWCDITNGGHWTIREWGEYDDSHILYCTKSQFQKLF